MTPRTLTHTPNPAPPVPLVGTGDLLNTVTVADVLGCTPRTVTRLIQRGVLPATRLGPGRTAYRVTTAALLAFVLRYGTHEPGTVADAPNPDALRDFTPEPVTLHARRTADGLLLVSATPTP
ncbi:hypothetical protein DEIPH_ctg042orf0003 [Deinococcus phoenicis]|uniref:Helix-turn-helix domain-containing protein n=1 Tax=Deinococcus phoenicis TaxID=1476583 RepID=A0A016QNQ1_9DEIO|nr:helix-turn-helix domain-containing protein [Deinococcus phoenicis]EYB67404.1 hypothetical protein DEIPH_ctg042orf0003 [Deinococcus phoenicis]